MRVPSGIEFLKVCLLCVPLIFVGCFDTGGDDGSNDNGNNDNGNNDPSQASARISGSVVLSSSVSGSNKPGILIQKGAATSLRSKPTSDRGVVVTRKPALNSGLNAIPLRNVALPVGGAFVYLYDAEQPDWVAPVAQDVTNSDGDYSLENYGCTDNVRVIDCDAKAATNDAAYVDGEPLPQGIYTMLIYKPSTFDPIQGITTEPIVSVLPAFKAEKDDFAVAAAEAEVSDASPSVVTMIGQKKNVDGTDSWGSAAVEIPANASLQVAFDMAMSRGSVSNITVATGGSAVLGKWTLSPDWLNATFKPAANLAAGEYTVSVPSSTVNVYSNAMGFKALGYFTATSIDTSAPTVSVISPDGAASVKTTTPIRLTASESLDLSKLRIASEPSIGDFPSAVLVKQGAGAYVYEINLTKPLKLDTDYALSFSGLQDDAGNKAADLSQSFTTEGADSAIGVDATAGAETQNTQAAVSDIFAKWLLAFNERSAAPIQALTSGSFVYEYSVQAEGGYRTEDVNRNGRLSLNEFMNMIEDGMVHWEYCQSTVTGEMIGPIDIASADSASFEFKLIIDSIDQSKDCSGNDDGSLYASVKKINGQWKLTRMSEGFDSRDTPLVAQEVIEAQLFEKGDNAEGEVRVANWNKLSKFADEQSPLTFKFAHVKGVETYILLLANDRDPEKLGFALAIPADRLACEDPSQCSASDGDALALTVPDPFGDDGMPEGASVINLFGFDMERDWGIGIPGETFIWEVLGLKSITPAEFNSDSPPSVVDLIRDISAVSPVKRFQNPGEFVRMDIQVSDDFEMQLDYNMYEGGYNAGTKDTVTISITTTAPEGVTNMAGKVFTNSSIGWAEYPVDLVANSAGIATGSVQVDLYNGWTWLDITNGEAYEQFNIKTSGGILPTITLTDLTGYSAEGNSAILGLDQWDFVDASTDVVGFGIDKISPSWALAPGDGVGGGAEKDFDIDDVLFMLVNESCAPDTGWANLSVSVWNSEGAYSDYSYCDNEGGVTGDINISGSTILLASDLDVYTGDNWVQLDIYGDAGNDSFYQTSSSFGLYTDAGSEFVPPIALVSLTTTEGVPEETGNWGQGSDWDATAVTIDEFGATVDQLALAFIFGDAGANPSLFGGSDGGQPADVELTTINGTDYTANVTLYQGYNWFNVDDGNGNWYGLNIFTENGKVFPKPEFLTANGVAIEVAEDRYERVEVVVDQCMVTLTGSAPYNTERLSVGWNGGNNVEGFNEWQDIQLPTSDDVNLPQEWTATFQLIGGANSRNDVNLWDETNQSYNDISITTTAADCTYSEPVMTVDGVSSNGTELVNQGGAYGFSDGSSGITALTTDTAEIYGTSSIAGKLIVAHSYVCGKELKFSTQALDQANVLGTYDWTLLIDMFDSDEAPGNDFNQYVSVSDGRSNSDLSLVSDNNNVPTPPMTLNIPVGLTEEYAGCDRAEWNGIDQATNLVNLVISGNTSNPKAANGFGEYQSAGDWNEFAIDGSGNFSFEVYLFDGQNQFYVGDGQGGNFNVEILTANGNLRPQYLTIETPTASSDGYAVGGVETVSVDGFFTDFNPDFLNAYVEFCVPAVGGNECIRQDVQFESGLDVANEWGDLPMALIPGESFSFDFDLPEGAGDVFIDVSGCGPDGCHGHSIHLNDGTDNRESRYYKPGEADRALPAYRHRNAHP